jgi:hypothetical protein
MGKNYKVEFIVRDSYVNYVSDVEDENEAIEEAMASLNSEPIIVDRYDVEIKRIVEVDNNKEQEDN